MKTAVLCVALLVLLQTLLGLAVVACRWKYKKAAGCIDDPRHMMFRIRTAFNNCSEWHPMLMISMLLLQFYGTHAWTVWLGPVVVAGRWLTVVGLTIAPIVKPNAYRAIGGLLTMGVSLLYAILLLTEYFQ